MENDESYLPFVLYMEQMEMFLLANGDFLPGEERDTNNNSSSNRTGEVQNATVY